MSPKNSFKPKTASQLGLIQPITWDRKTYLEIEEWKGFHHHSGDQLIEIQTKLVQRHRPFGVCHWIECL